MTLMYFIEYIDYGTVLRTSGMSTCKHTSLLTPIVNSPFTSLVTGPFNVDQYLSTPLPSSYLSSVGLILPPNCSQIFPGDPVEQIPVAYLTLTTTIDNVPAFTINDEPGSQGTITSPALITPPASPGGVLSPVTPPITSGHEPTATAPSAGMPSSDQGSRPESPGQESSPDQQSLPSPGYDPESPRSMPNPNKQTTISLGGVPLIISSTKLIVGSQTLVPGGAPATYKGTLVSLAPSATAIVIGTNTFTLTPGSAPTATASPVLTIGQSVYTENSDTAFIIAGQTLKPGGEITVDGTKISFPSTANAIVVGSSTHVLTPADKSSDALVLTLGSSIYTGNSASGLVIAGQTLVPGAQITISGTVVSLAPGGTVITVGSSTEALNPGISASSADPNVGGEIYSMFNGGGGTASSERRDNTVAGSSASVLALTSDTSSRRPALVREILLLMVMLMLKYCPW